MRVIGVEIVWGLSRGAPVGVVDIITFLPLNVNWTFRGEGGKAMEAIVRGIFGHVEQRSLHYLRESRTN